MEVHDTDFFTRNERVPGIGYAPLLSEAAFLLSSQKMYPQQAFDVNNLIYIIKWIDRKDVLEEDFKKEKNTYKQTLIMSRERRVFDIWLQSLKRKAEIEIVSPVE